MLSVTSKKWKLMSLRFTQTNPLEASPANHEISQSKVDKEGKTGGASGGQVTKDRESAAQSGGSGAPKSGGGKSG
jgi:hypothetical protein